MVGNPISENERAQIEQGIKGRLVRLRRPTGVVVGVFRVCGVRGHRWLSGGREHLALEYRLKPESCHPSNDCRGGKWHPVTLTDPLNPVITT